MTPVGSRLRSTDWAPQNRWYAKEKRRYCSALPTAPTDSNSADSDDPTPVLVLLAVVPV